LSDEHVHIHAAAKSIAVSNVRISSPCTTECYYFSGVYFDLLRFAQ